MAPVPGPHGTTPWFARVARHGRIRLQMMRRTHWIAAALAVAALALPPIGAFSPPPPAARHAHARARVGPDARPPQVAGFLDADAPTTTGARAATGTTPCGPGPDSPAAPGGIEHAFGGEIHALAVHGALAYLGLGPRLAVLDVTDPAAARMLGVTPPLPGRVVGVHVSGAYAYAVTRQAGLRAIAVSDLATPRPVGWLALPGPVAGIHGMRDHLYVAGRGLHVVEVTDPTAPALVTTLDPERPLAAVAVAAERAYFGGPDGRLSIYGLADPARPAWLAEVRLGGPITGLAVAGDRVVVAGGVPEGRGLVIVDVGRPDAPRPTGMLLFDQPLAGVAARGDTAYATDVQGGWSIVDLDRPDGPAVLATVAPEAGVGGLAVPSGPLVVAVGRAYVAMGGRLTTWDVRDPAAPGRLGAASAGWPALGVVVHAGSLYVAAGAAGVWGAPLGGSLDPAGPGLATGADAVPPRGAVVDVAMAGGHLLAADAAGALLVFDTPPRTPADPLPVSSPTLAGRLATGAPAWRVAGAGDHGYILLGDRDVWVVDLTDPTRPVTVAVYSPPEADLLAGDRLTDLATDGVGLYLATARSGVLVVDVATPIRPRPIARIARGGDRVRLAGGHLFTWRVDHDLRVFDVRAPAAPVEVGRLTDPGWRLLDLAVAGTTAHAIVAEEPAVVPADPAADPAIALWRLDVSTPAAPRVAAARPWPLSASALAAAADRVAVAAGADGLVVVDPDGAPRPAPCRLYLPALPASPEPDKAPVVERVWQWANVNAPADGVRLRVLAGPGEGGRGLAMGDARRRVVLRPVAGAEPGMGAGLALARAVDTRGIAWGVDDVDADGRAELWDVAAGGAIWVHDLTGGLSARLGRLEIDDDAQVRAAAVAELFGDGQPLVVALLAPPPNPLGPPRERWWLQAWRLPSLAPVWRFGIDGVPAGLSSDRLVVAQVDGDPAREVVVSFPGSRRPGSAFPHGWVVDPALSAAQWTTPAGFGAHLAAADLDADGLDEIVGAPVEPSGTVVAAFDVDRGAEKWRAPRPPAVLQAGDVAGNAAAEVVVGSLWGGITILDGATGAVARDIRDPSLSGAIRALAIGDLDGAPGAEVGWSFQPAGAAVARLVMLAAGAALPVDIAARHAGPYWPAVLRPAADPPIVLAFPQGDGPPGAAGWARWLALDGPSGAERPAHGLSLGLPLDGPAPDGGSVIGAPQAVEIDADRWPELAVGWGGVLVLLDHDGTILARRDLTADGVGALRPAGAGDTDGDGVVELVAAARGAVIGLRAADLQPLWRLPGPGGAVAEVAVGDLDGDRAAEVVVAAPGRDVEAWGGPDRRRKAVLAATAWSAAALAIAPPRPGERPALGVVLDRRLAWFGADGAALGPGIDLPTWDETSRLAFVPRPGGAPWLVVSGGGGLHVYPRYADPGDARPSASFDVGAPIRWLATADVDGSGEPAVVAGLDDGVQVFRVHP